MDCTGHCNVSVTPETNVAKIDIWCTGTCDTNGKCKAVWISEGDFEGLHLMNEFPSESEATGIVHQIRQYEIRATTENFKLHFSCDCGDTAKKFTATISRLEHQNTVGDRILNILEGLVTLGGLIGGGSKAAAADAALKKIRDMAEGQKSK